MPSFSTQIEIEAPAEFVWAVLSDIERWPEWTRSVTTLRRLDHGPIQLGSRVAIQQPRLPPNVLTVTDWQPPRQFTWETRNAVLTGIGLHAIEPLDRGCLVTLTFRFQGLLGPVVGWLYGALTREYIELEAAGLKERSETLVATALRNDLRP